MPYQFNGYSQFNMAIGASNAGVKLVRRMYYRTPNQKADVYIDNVLAGTWYTPGSRDGVRRDAAFWIPTARRLEIDDPGSHPVRQRRIRFLATSSITPRTTSRAQ